MPAPDDDQAAPFRIAPRIAERRVMEVAFDQPGSAILCTTLGRAQAAAALARQRSEARVDCWFLDLHHQRLAAAALGRPIELPATSPELAPNLSASGAPNPRLICAADPPEESIDLAVLPFSKQGEAELTRETLQLACQRLQPTGTLIAAVDQPRDRWLRMQLAELFEKVTVKSFDDAVVYQCRKLAPLRKVRNYRCEFSFRDRDRIVRLTSRPGVFSHRRLDPGARQLIEVAAVEPGMRILDIGCGAGAVGLALAAREPTAAVHGIDGNARAVEASLAGAALNELDNVTAELCCDGRCRGAGEYDLAVANPPYYADFRIAQLFVDAAGRALHAGGRLLAVTKRPDWYEQSLPDRWRQVERRPSRRYYLVSAIRP